MWGRGPRGNNAACSALCRLSVTAAATYKQIGPFWCWFPGGWVCVHSRTLWVSPVNSPVRLGVSPTTATKPTSFYREVWRLYFPILEPWVARTVSLPTCFSWFIHMQMWDHPVHQPPYYCDSSPPRLPISAPPTGLNECFFFNSLVGKLPYSSISWPFWLGVFLFIFKCVVFLFVVKRGTVYLAMPPSWPGVQDL